MCVYVPGEENTPVKLPECVDRACSQTVKHKWRQGARIIGINSELPSFSF